MLQHFHEKNRDLIVNVNGRLLHRDQASVSPFDSAVQGGDAVWEGLRLYNGRIFRLIEHLDRLRSSARALDFAEIPTHDSIIHEIRRTLAANQMRDAVHIRLTLTRGVKYTSGMDPRLNTAGPTLIILAEHKPPVYDKTGITLITSTIRRFSPDTLDPKIHHCNLIQSILAKIQANQAGADDALMLDTRGFVAETNATHVFIVARSTHNRPPSSADFPLPSETRPRSGIQNSPSAFDPDAPHPTPCPHDSIVLTPFCHACPEGITRAAVLGLCRSYSIPHVERDLSLTEIYRADEMFCTGTMGELAPVLRVDGRTIGDGHPGPMTRRLTDLFHRLTESEGVPVVD